MWYEISKYQFERQRKIEVLSSFLLDPELKKKITKPVALTQISLSTEYDYSKLEKMIDDIRLMTETLKNESSDPNIQTLQDDLIERINKANGNIISYLTEKFTYNDILNVYQSFLSMNFNSLS